MPLPTLKITAPMPSNTLEFRRPIAVTIIDAFSYDSGRAYTHHHIHNYFTHCFNRMPQFSMLLLVPIQPRSNLSLPTPLGFIAALPKILSPLTIPFIIAANPPRDAFMPPGAFPVHLRHP